MVKTKKTGTAGKTTRKAPARKAKVAKPISPEDYILPHGYVLCLRSNKGDMRSYNDFQWPKSGEVAAPDWSTKKECGNGLHGLLWGTGDVSLLYLGEDAKWLVVEVLSESIIDLNRKVKFPRCNVVYCGNLIEAANLIGKFAPLGTQVIGGTATAGDRGTATAGYRGTATAGYSGTATAGDWGTATAGYSGTATAGYSGTATAGDRGTATAGDWGTATAGDWGTATAGDRGTATAGDRGTATAGDWGTATAGDWGTATAGDRGTATAGDRGTATAGDWGVLQLSWWDSKAHRRRIVTKYVGEDGIKPNTPYTIDEFGNVTEVVK